MKRLLSAVIVLTALALVATPAMAEVQNVKVSGDIKVMGIYRDDFDLTGGSDDQAGWYQSIARVQIDADLTDNVSTCIRFLNERDWDAESSTNSAVDLDLANITMQELFFAPMTLIVGRQEMKYGSGLVIGDPDRNDASTANDITAVNYSARKAFDAIRAIIELDAATVELFTAKVDEDTTEEANDVDLYGIDVATVMGGADVAGYVIFENDQASVDTGEDTLVIGARGNMALTDALNANLEIALQTGDYADERDQDAWALDMGLDYAMDANMSPVLGLAYKYRSGAKAGASDGDQEAWMPLYEDQTNGLVADYLFDGLNNGVNSNCHIIKAGASVTPIQDMTASIDYYQYILDEKFATGSSFTFNEGTATMKADDDLGREVDLKLTYDYTDDVQFGLTSAWFMPGDAFDGSYDETATEVVGSIDVSF